MGWSKPLGGFINVVEAEHRGRLKKAASMAINGVIYESPVDEGTFRGNHIVSVGGPDQGYDESIQDPESDTTLMKGFRVIAEVDNPFSLIYIQNNLPYAQPLEDGHSDQAPGGIYAVTFNNLKEEFR